jgi:hypothetical protein
VNIDSLLTEQSSVIALYRVTQQGEHWSVHANKQVNGIYTDC